MKKKQGHLLSALIIGAGLALGGIGGAHPAAASPTPILHEIAPQALRTCPAGQTIHLVIRTSGTGTVTSNWGSGSNVSHAGGTATVFTGQRSIASLNVSVSSGVTLISTSIQCAGPNQTPPNCAPGGMCAVLVPFDGE